MTGTRKTLLDERFVKIAGWLIVGIALFYVGQRLVENAGEFDTVLVTFPRLTLLIACTFGFAAALVPIAIVWGKLANPQPGFSPPLWQTFSIYGRSQFAKYIPGNVFHYAGRQVLGRQLGWSQSNMALASVLETFLIGAAAASIILTYGIFIEDAVFALIPKVALGAGLAASVAAPWLIVAFAHRIPFLRKSGVQIKPAKTIQNRLLLQAYSTYLTYFAATGALAYLALGIVGGSMDATMYPAVAASFIVAWLIGYVTPGASGGLGVREAAFILILSTTLSEPTVIALALTLRVASTLADTLIFAASHLIHRKFNKDQSASD